MYSLSVFHWRTQEPHLIQILTLKSPFETFPVTVAPMTDLDRFETRRTGFAVAFSFSNAFFFNFVYFLFCTRGGQKSNNVTPTTGATISTFGLTVSLSFPRHSCLFPRLLYFLVYSGRPSFSLSRNALSAWHWCIIGPDEIERKPENVSVEEDTPDFLKLRVSRLLHPPLKIVMASIY